MKIKITATCEVEVDPKDYADGPFEPVKSELEHDGGYEGFVLLAEEAHNDPADSKFTLTVEEVKP